MHRKLDDIEIVEPPIEELAKRHGGLARACFSGCGLLLILIVLAAAGLKLAVGPGPKTLKTIPPEFPADIPVYDKENIETITFMTGRYKNRGLEVAAFFPKIILSPFLLKLSPDSAPTAGGSETDSKKDLLKKLWKIIATPIGDHRDLYQIEWRDLDATPGFIAAYYKNELKKKKFAIDVESEGQGVKQFSFSRSDGFSGSVYVKEPGESQRKTGYVCLTVNVPTTTAR